MCLHSTRSLSLIQFTLVVTTFYNEGGPNDATGGSGNGGGCCGRRSEDAAELCSIGMVFFLQDGPFLVTRMFMVYNRVVDYMLLFFLLKVITYILYVISSNIKSMHNWCFLAARMVTLSTTCFWNN